MLYLMRIKERPMPMGAHVEIVEHRPGLDAADLPCIKPNMVRVNGVDVGLLAKDGVEVLAADDDTTMIRLTLLPRTVTIKAE